jgi:DNA polymerase III delta prime subunit
MDISQHHKKKWIFKYKPTKFDDIVSHNEIVNIIKNSLDNLPHMIFYGPNGIGKSSLINIIVKSIYTVSDLKQNVLYLSASDKRGIGTVRQEIKSFAHQSVFLQNSTFKMIILSEIDCMSFEAQSALRRIIEKYSKTTRFCLICNSINKISKPIISRCVKFLFKPIPDKLIQTKLLNIANDEKLNENIKKIIPNISSISKGDLRKSINLLETLSKSSNISHDEIKNYFYFLTDQIDNIYIQNLLNVMNEGDLIGIREKIKDIFYQGYSSKNILYELYSHILNDEEINDKKKKNILKILGETDYKITLGGNQNLNILNFCYKYTLLIIL